MLLAVLVSGINAAWGEDEVFYTLTPATGSNNAYASSCDVTISDITWNVTGNATLIPWRIGGKSLSNENRTVFSKTALGSAITKVELKVGAASSITVNSLKLIVASDNAFSDVIDEVTKTFSANSTITFTPSSPATNWESGAYYKFVFNVSVSGTSNKFVEFSEAKFYKESGGGSSCATPTFDPAAGAVAYGTPVAISSSTDGATIYYTLTTDGTTPEDPTAGDSEYSGPINITAATKIKAIAIDSEGTLSNSVVASASYTIADPTTPTFSPAAGSVLYGSPITLSSDEGTTIYYTTNGDTPDNTCDEYDPEDKPTITEGITIKVIAYDAGGNASAVGSADYTLKAPSDPVFSLAAGLVTKGASLTLTSSAGATIRYTTDGTTPTSSEGSVYSSPITINSAQTIKAIAYDGAGTSSSVVTKAYTVFVGDIVTFDAKSDTGTSPLSKNGVSFICSNGVLNNESEYRLYSSSTTTISTSEGKITRIVFTMNGSYSSTLLSTNTGTYSEGTWTGSATSVAFSASAQARVDAITVYVAKTAAPTFSVATNVYNEAKSVELSCATDGATIYYTTNGDTPTSSSTAYSSSISVTETQTIMAIAIYDGVESAVSSATYTINRPAAPTFDVDEGVFDAAFDLQLSSETEGATIYYTTDGSTPTTSSSVYSTKVAISTATTTVKAIAVKNGLTSDVSSATYTYDSRETPTFTLSSTSIGLKVNETSSTVTLTTNSDGDVTFTCADAHVTLTGTGNSRTISANAAGTYTVIVTVTDSEDYKDAEGTVTVTVTKKASTVITTPSFTNKDMYSTPKFGSFTGVAQYNSSNIADAEVTYSSSDETVATINESTGAVTFVGVGSTTLTASYAGDDEYEAAEASYVLTLYDTTPQEMEVEITLNNTFFGCSSFNSWTNKMATSFTGKQNKVTVIYGKGSTSNMYCTAEKIRFYDYNSFTITAPTGYHVISVDMNATISSATPSGTISGDTWTGDAESVSFTFAHKTDLTSMTVTLAEVFTVGSAGYTTYVTKHAVSFPSGVKAYIVTDKDSETLTLTETASAPKSTPLILKANADTYKLTVIDEEDAADVTGNMLHAAELDGSTKGNGTSIYALGVGKVAPYEGVVGFYLVNNGQTVPAGKAYLEVTAPGVKGFTFDFDGVATGVNAIAKGQEATANGQIFNLAGQRVNKAQKGLYIVNGKKVLVK